jgi:hypothetical protein
MDGASEGQATDGRPGRGLRQKAVEQNKFQRSSREPYDRIMGWLLSRVGRS